jgi:hypothetical protein
MHCFVSLRCWLDKEEGKMVEEGGKTREGLRALDPPIFRLGGFVPTRWLLGLSKVAQSLGLASREHLSVKSEA